MITIYGPAGSGKSTQGELLAERLGRKALSVGQICREQFTEYTKNGDMVPEPELIRAVMKEVKAAEARNGAGVVLDCQPWSEAATRMMKKIGMMQEIELALVLDVPRDECLRRLGARGRSDDRAEVWQKKLDMYEQKIYTFLAGLKEYGVPVEYVNGDDTIENVTRDLAALALRGRSR